MTDEPFRGQLIWDPDTKTFKQKAKPRTEEIHHVQTDEISETESYATDERRHFTSKKKLYQHYKENGFHVKERGEDPRPPQPYKADPTDVRETTERAMMDIKYDRIQFTEEEKERWRREERAYKQWKRRQQ